MQRVEMAQIRNHKSDKRSRLSLRSGKMRAISLFILVWLASSASPSLAAKPAVDKYFKALSISHMTACLSQEKKYSKSEIGRFIRRAVIELGMSMNEFKKELETPDFEKDLSKMITEKGGIERGCRSVVDFYESIRDEKPKDEKRKNDNEAHEKCKEVIDYEGCMKVQLKEVSQSTEDDCVPDRWCMSPNRVDTVGMPTIKGWYMYESPARRKVGYRRPGAQRVNVGGDTSRYFAIEMIARFWKAGGTGTQATAKTVGSGIANCYGSSTTMSCVLETPKIVTTQGLAPTPPGVEQETIHGIYDCKERTHAMHMNYSTNAKWEKADGAHKSRLDEYCPIIESLDLSSFNGYADKK